MLRDLFSLFPAYAGVIPGNAANDRKRKAFPRIRGGDPRRQSFAREQVSFSPHTRG